MPLVFNVNADNAMDYVYRNGKGEEWILTQYLGDHSWQYEFSLANPTLIGKGDIWFATNETLSRFANRPIDLGPVEMTTPLLRKIKKLEERFQTRGVAHG
jgi:hypothetical protein